MPGVSKLTDLDDAILAVVFFSESQCLTYREIREELRNRGFDISEEEVETSVQQLRNLGYLSTKKE